MGFPSNPQSRLENPRHQPAEQENQKSQPVLPCIFKNVVHGRIVELRNKKTSKPVKELGSHFVLSTPGRTRTSNPWFRRPVLYPIELRVPRWDSLTKSGRITNDNDPASQFHGRSLGQTPLPAGIRPVAAGNGFSRPIRSRWNSP